MTETDPWHVPTALRTTMNEVARQFRKQPTCSEALLWQALRGKQLDGRKFRHQQPIGPFVVDFFCSSQRLIVEVDGPLHDSQQQADKHRQQLLESLGLRFIRVSAEQVEHNLPSVLETIKQAFITTPIPGPSPIEGEREDILPSPGLGEGPGERAKGNDA